MRTNVGDRRKERFLLNEVDVLLKLRITYHTTFCNHKFLKQIGDTRNSKFLPRFAETLVLHEDDGDEGIVEIEASCRSDLQGAE